MATTAHLDAVTAQYGNLYSGRKADEGSVTIRTKVAITKLRRKLSPLGVNFETLWGIGYAMRDEDKAKLKAALEAWT